MKGSRDRGFLLILIIVIVLMLSIGIIAFLYFRKNDTESKIGPEFNSSSKVDEYYSFEGTGLSMNINSGWNVTYYPTDENVTYKHWAISNSENLDTIDVYTNVTDNASSACNPTPLKIYDATYISAHGGLMYVDWSYSWNGKTDRRIYVLDQNVESFGDSVSDGDVINNIQNRILKPGNYYYCSDREVAGRNLSSEDGESVTVSANISAEATDDLESSFATKQTYKDIKEMLLSIR